MTELSVENCLLASLVLPYPPKTQNLTSSIKQKTVSIATGCILISYTVYTLPSTTMTDDIRIPDAYSDSCARLALKINHHGVLLTYQLRNAQSNIIPDNNKQYT